MDGKMFIDLHVIQTVPPSCINRDDTNSPKTAVYGGVKRARVSSQCWKNAMRSFFKDEFDAEQSAYRTKRIVDLISDRITVLDASVTKESAVELAVKILGTAGVKVKTNKKDGSIQETGALFFIGAKQVDNMAKLALEGCEDKKTVQAALNKDTPVEIALFGRMVADDPSLNCDACAQVAHSISTHRVDTEFDYFTAIDELNKKDESGAGMIGTIEYNSSTLYRYSTVAVHQLFNELNQDKEVTIDAVSTFIRGFILSMPTGKQNTFANRTVPNAVVVSVRKDQPINLSSAFETPVKGSDGYVKGSIDRLMDEKEKCSMFVSEPVSEWTIGIDGGSSLNDVIASVKEYLAAEL